MSNHVDLPGSESDNNLMDYGILDLSSAFGQKQYGRSDAKIKKLQSGGMTSDEDISTAGSPSIRRRLGSCSGGPDKDETYSPGEGSISSPQSWQVFSWMIFEDVTPNGTLRRRRSRVPCEDDDGNLMDYLRTTGQDSARERKSWGSLGELGYSISHCKFLEKRWTTPLTNDPCTDRSWAKRARGQPRRGDLLNADFSADRERPSSPSPLVGAKSFTEEEEAKPMGYVRVVWVSGVVRY